MLEKLDASAVSLPQRPNRAQIQKQDKAILNDLSLKNGHIAFSSPQVPEYLRKH